METTFDLDSLLRPHIKKIKPYSSARSEYKGEGIFLDANENSIGSVAIEMYNRYPDPLQQAVKNAIGDYQKINTDNIFLSNGSDEAIDYIIRLFCEPYRDKILIFEPTFGMYESAATINNIEIVRESLNKKFQIDVESTLNTIENNDIKVVFICTPNNPTGNSIHSEDIKILLQSFKGIVVVDEAYVDFSSEASWIENLKKCPNLIVLQTFSKSWGLAGLRLGVTYASKEIIETMNLVKQPYNVNEYTQKVALEAFKNIETKQKLLDQLKDQKLQLGEELSLHKAIQKIYPSDANFFLAKVEDANDLYQFLIERKIIVRNRTTTTGCENCIRITVGSKEENNLLIEALDEYSRIKEQEKEELSIQEEETQAAVEEPKEKE